jgi:hypothetical protein
MQGEIVKLAAADGRHPRSCLLDGNMSRCFYTCLGLINAVKGTTYVQTRKALLIETSASPSYDTSLFVIYLTMLAVAQTI